jgi:hypothetical protein
MSDFERFELRSWHAKGMVTRLEPEQGRGPSRDTEVARNAIIVVTVISVGFSSGEMAIAAGPRSFGTAISPLVVENTDRTSPDPEQAPDLRDRLSEIGSLEAGWFDGRGAALDRDFVNRAGLVLAQACAAAPIPEPYLYPTIDGGLSAEWTLGDWQISARIESRDARVFATAVNARTGESEEEEFALSSSVAPVRIGRFVLRHRATRSS